MNSEAYNGNLQKRLRNSWCVVGAATTPWKSAWLPVALDGAPRSDCTVANLCNDWNYRDPDFEGVDLEGSPT